MQLISSKLKMKSGQSAMEFLMTYGWAILIIIVVVAVLFYIGVLNPRNTSPTSCMFPPGMSCVSSKLLTTGYMQLTLGQATGHRIEVTNVSCTRAQDAQNWSAVSPNVSINSGESAYVGLFMCTNSDGSIASGDPGESGKFKIWVRYTQFSEPTQKTLVGDFTGRYETPSGNEGTPLEPEEIAVPTPTPVCESSTTVCTGYTCTQGSTCISTASSCACCGNGICNTGRGENPSNCGDDCPECSGQATGTCGSWYCTTGSCIDTSVKCSCCGNGVCDTANGEDETNCADDCAPAVPGTCSGAGCACYSGDQCQPGGTYDVACTDAVPACEYAPTKTGICCKECIDQTGVPQNDSACNCVTTSSCATYQTPGTWTNCTNNPDQSPCYLKDASKRCCKQAAPSGTTISVCDPTQAPPAGSLINALGTYTLSGPLSYSGTASCIRVLPGANGGTLDCGITNTITGTGKQGNGIILDGFPAGFTSFTVKNCRVQNFDNGLMMDTATGCLIKSNMFVSNDNGVFLFGDETGNTFQSNTITGNTGQDFWCVVPANINIDLGNTCTNAPSCTSWLTCLGG